jgi:hypothetical protein
MFPFPPAYPCSSVAAKCLLLFTVFVLLPSIALGHPGKTDRWGGHRCWRGCADWKLDYGEYHFHDKDLMPIRLKKISVTSFPAASRRTPDEPAASAVSGDAVTGGERNSSEKKIPQTPATQVGSAVDEAIAPAGGCDLALSALLFLLLAVFLFIRKRRRGRENR